MYGASYTCLAVSGFINGYRRCSFSSSLSLPIDKARREVGALEESLKVVRVLIRWIDFSRGTSKRNNAGE